MRCHIQLASYRRSESCLNVLLRVLLKLCLSQPSTLTWIFPPQLSHGPPSFDHKQITVFPRNLAAPRIVAAFEISPRNSNAQGTKRRPRILAACGKGSSLLLRAYYTIIILTLILNNAQCARSPIVLYYIYIASSVYISRRPRNLAALEMSPRQTGPRN